MKKTLFEKIINVLLETNKEIIENCEEDKSSRKFNLKDFLRVITYYFLNNSGSLRLLETEYNTTSSSEVHWETIRDCFTRFNWETFRDMYANLVSKLDIMSIKELDNIGKVSLVDGSHFQLDTKSDWAEYRKNKNGIKLHLEWNLNEMRVERFRITKGKASERGVLDSLIEKDVIYVADRGYIGFKLFKSISERDAYFVIRLKQYSLTRFIVESEENITGFGKVKDCLVTFINDRDKQIYRLIVFRYCGKLYKLLTNNLELTTEEVIMVYSCRWQIELFFRYLKGVLNCHHLLSHSLNGLYIQFYISSIVHLILLYLKQICIRLSGLRMVSNFSIEELLSVPVSSFSMNTKRFWKISIHFLRYLRKVLEKPPSESIVRVLATI